MSGHYDIPSWAGKPPTGLHLDVMKETKLVQKLMIDDKNSMTFCIDHQSCSRVHAASSTINIFKGHSFSSFLGEKESFEEWLGKCLKFLIILSAHGTYIGSVRIE
ncbi:Nuclear inhibitor of protein phosphatase 1like, partial [Caligus rogercresseyi]